MSNWDPYLANGVAGPIAERKDLEKFSDEELFLFALGLRRFQQVDIDKPVKEIDPNSYYKIAGIHGLPYETWPLKDWNKEIPGLKDPQGGFCTHTSIVFLTWHRPYLALFESNLHKHVNAIANDIVDSDEKKEKYLSLAKSFRLPYWDWARKSRNIFPKQALYSTFEYNDKNFREPVLKNPPKGGYNPFFQAPFPKGSELINKDYPYNTTVRYPGQKNPQEQIEKSLWDFWNNDASQQWAYLIQNVEANLSERVGLILRSYQRYASMSTNSFWRRFPRDSKEREKGKEETRKDLLGHSEIYGSIEDFHNAVHDLIGGDGHMANTQTSAFDPIFWLHHCNIDRLFAIWQALHDDNKSGEAYVTVQPGGDGSFVRRAWQGKEGPDDPLYPFKKTGAPNGWHTSHTAKRTEDFGYTYPETTGLKYPPSAEALKGLIQRTKDLYPTFDISLGKSQRGIPTAGAEFLAQTKVLTSIAKNDDINASVDDMVKVVSDLPDQKTLLAESNAGNRFLKDMSNGNKYLEWLFNIKAQKHALGGRYSVHVFLGPVQEPNISLWPISPNHVGSFYPLGQPEGTGCGKCQQDQEDKLQITGQIPLTIALAERYLGNMLGDYSEERVVNYLKENLHWRVVDSNRTILENRSDIPDLVVFVSSNEATLPENEDELPTYAADVKIYPEVTTKAGSNAGRGNGTGFTGWV